MSVEILDNINKSESKESLSSSIAWWEKKRIWFNIAVGASGVIAIVLSTTHFNFDDFIWLVIYGVFANILYSIGFLIEALNQYYLNQKIRLYKIRMILFIAGTLFSCLVTFTLTIFYYSSIFIFYYRL